MESYEFDIVVVGGGLSGVSAAIAAARCGRRVALVERTDILGGMATLALVNPMQTFHSPSGQVIRGFGQELVDDLMAKGACLGHVPDPIGFVSSLTPFDSDMMAELLLGKCREASVAMFFRHRLTDIVPGASGALDGIIASGPNEETLRLYARAFVDAGGNGDLTLAAGAPMEIDPGHQPMSLLFILGGVRPAEIIEFQKKRPEEFHMAAPDVLDLGYVAVSGFFSAVAEARESGELNIPRDRLLFFNTTRPDQVTVNTTRIMGLHGLSDDELDAARELGELQVNELVSFMKKRIPGFENSFLVKVAREVGVRETRRLLGRYVLNEDELIESANHDDVIAKGAYPLDIHRQNSEGITTFGLRGKQYYDIPLRCLLNTVAPNLVTIGKSLSVSHNGYSSTRVMPTCLAVGQAGGVAASFAADDPLGDLTTHTGKIQKTLLKQGAILYDEQVK